MDKKTEGQIRKDMLNNIGRTDVDGNLIPLSPEDRLYWNTNVLDTKREKEIMDSNLMCEDNLENVRGSLEITAQEQIGAADCTRLEWNMYFSKPCMDRILDSELMNETIDEAFANSNVKRNEVYTMSLLRRCCADIANDFAEA